jgi:hypothetical protein
LTKLGHFGLFRPGPAERIWRDIAAFALEHSAAARAQGNTSEVLA